MKNIVIVSGGFDPLTSGHIDYLEGAAKLGEVIVLLNSDHWLTRKKGKPFMCFDEREKILKALKSVLIVVPANDEDGTVSYNLRRVPSLVKNGSCTSVIVANGGDRTEETTPEVRLCKELGIETVFNVGGDKTQSSSDLLKQWSNND